MSKAIDFLLSIPMFQNVGIAAFNRSLDKITEIDRRLGSAHKDYKVIHVGGTNGKGSTSHMTTSALLAAGYRVGLYTSPHLVSFRERIRVDGEMINETYIEKFVEENMELIEELKPSFFEITTALAFCYFRDCGVDYAVIEVGLGGLYDATNIVDPLLTVITNISKDHTAILGNTVAEIATQKGGIIKPEVPIIIGESSDEYNDIFIDIARQRGAEILFADQEFSLKSYEKCSNSMIYELEESSGEIRSYTSQLSGSAQRKNILTAVTACRALRLDPQIISKGFATCATDTGLRGRWQQICDSPLTICDTAHNESGIGEVVSQLAEIDRHKIIVFGVVEDKDLTAVLSLLPRDAYYIFTKPNVIRGMDENKLMYAAFGAGLGGESQPTVAAAYSRAKEIARKDDMIFIGGSTFVVAEVF